MVAPGLGFPGVVTAAPALELVAFRQLLTTFLGTKQEA